MVKIILFVWAQHFCLNLCINLTFQMLQQFFTYYKLLRDLHLLAADPLNQLHNDIGGL